MTKIKTILIDDERKALSILKNKIERYCPDLDIIAETQSPEKGLELIDKLQPQLVFIDIAMPVMNGFDVLANVKKPNFEIIFVTAFDQYAIDAINYSAIGYLLKPVDNETLIATVIKASKNIADKSALEKNKLLIENLGIQNFQKKKIVIPSADGLEFVKIDAIIHCEGVDGYTKIHFSNQKPILSSQSIGHFNKILQQQDFYLVHKSHLINLEHIKKYLNEGYVLLSENHKVPVSRNRRQDFLNNLKG
ncbi:LytTR family DNA-binding domain-containing protein [Polaribacter sp. AHE13PA]|uniref:LytR/AlgR family response regulator transcription factor n=1 Tax=Polaribacter sp. AHE13PA TaxID=2745562 RepID=UPI001C4E5B37|nr:LytTR family DNA-binding domain-containing protein [Polaribacter sp. AHE13PA]QXP66776.1 response regulator transcription factor [Polaribacter sp. AHE13PA]